MKLLYQQLLLLIKTKRLNVFFMFLLVSFCILVLTKLAKPHTNKVVCNVVCLGVEEEVVILNSNELKVEVSFKANGYTWLNYVFSEPEITMNLQEDARLDKTGYLWDLEANKSKLLNQLPKGIKDLNFITKHLFIKTDRNDSKLVPVKLNTQISFLNGFDVMYSEVATPDVVKIIGPLSVLSKIDSVNTKVLVKSNINKPELLALKLDIDSLLGQLKFSKTKVNVMVTAERFTEGQVEIPIVLVNVPENQKVTIFPKTTTLSFYTSINNYEKVLNKDFKAICDFKSISQSSNTLPVKLIKSSKFVKSSKISDKQVEYIVTNTYD